MSLYRKFPLGEMILFGIVIVLLALGTYARNQLWNDEVALWDDCARKSPRKARPYENLSFAYINAGIYDKALGASEKAIEIDPKSASGYYNLSIVSQKRGDLEKAIAMAKKSLEIDPTLHMAYYTLGGIYLEDHQMDQAAEAFRTFLKVSPDFPNIHHLLGVVYAGQRRFDQAVTEFEWEVRLNPYHTLAHLNLGQIYWHEFQNRKKALYHLKVSLALDPWLPNKREIQNLIRMLEGASS